MSDKKTKNAEAVASLRAEIAARLNIDTDTGAFTTSEGEDIYTASLPEGLTTDVIKSVHDHNTMFVAASTGAVVDKVVEAFKVNKDLTQVNYELPMFGKDKLQIMANRDGSLNVGVVTSVVNPKAGSLKAVFAEFNDSMDELAK